MFVAGLMFAVMVAQTQQSAQPPAAPPGAACSRPEYRQFDFWVGRWDVTANGQKAGTNEIQSLHGGCVLFESWKGIRGMTGSSINIYVAGDKQWQQTWADSTGSLLVLRGAMRNGSMQMTGTGYQPGSAPSLNRITWTPNGDGSIRQLWETSSDDGKTWSVVFDGRYLRMQ